MVRNRTRRQITIGTFLKNILLGKYWQNFLDLVFPRKCRFCKKLLSDEHLPTGVMFPKDFFCCSACLQKLIPDNQPCPSCGGTKYSLPPDQKKCPSCKNWKRPFDSVIALIEYKEPYKSRIHYIKFDTSGEAARFWTKIFLFLRKEKLQQLGADLVIPIPMYVVRKIRRRINASDIIADEIGKALKIPVGHRLLVRSKWTKRQAFLSPKDRELNVKGTFALSRKSFFRRNSRDITGQTILLVDDILTTGATCGEAAKILIEGGAAKVYVAVIGRGQGAARNSFYASVYRNSKKIEENRKNSD